MKTLYWDFFGPRAEGIATHYLHHLEEFLRQNNILECSLGTSVHPGAASVWCTTNLSNSEILTRSLKPRRIEDKKMNTDHFPVDGSRIE